MIHGWVGRHPVAFAVGGAMTGLFPVPTAKPPVRGSLRVGPPSGADGRRPGAAAGPRPTIPGTAPDSVGILPAVKWLGVVILAVVGVLAAIAAIVYFSEPIHSLPSFFPGHHALEVGHPAVGTGHYHKGGAGAALVAVVCIAAAVVLTIRFTRKDSAPPAPTSAGDLLSGNSSPAGPPAQ